jgi:hypothetical protein
MTLSYTDTKILFEFVINNPPEDIRHLLHLRLNSMKWTEPEFCAGIIEHGPFFNYNADQWFDFFQKIPNQLFKYETKLLNKLSGKQRSMLQFE